MNDQVEKQIEEDDEGQMTIGKLVRLCNKLADLVLAGEWLGQKDEKLPDISVAIEAVENAILYLPKLPSTLDYRLARVQLEQVWLHCQLFELVVERAEAEAGQEFQLKEASAHLSCALRSFRNMADGL